MEENVITNPLAGVAPKFGGEQYERLTHRNQILLRPDMYIGSPAGITNDTVWLAQISQNQTLDFVPIRITLTASPTSSSISGISKEAFDNASDNVQRSREIGIDPGTIDVEMTQNSLTIRNYGKHIPIVIHHKEKIWVPQLIFGELLTSDNYNDSDSMARYKIGRNGYGIKLTNIFSIIFKLTIGDPEQKLKYTQVWQNNMGHVSEPIIEPYDGPGFTEITFVPDFPRLYGESNTPPAFLESMQGYYLARTMSMSFSAQIITRFNGIELDYRSAETFFEAHMETKNPLRKQIHWRSADGNDEFVVADTPGKGFQLGYVNGVPVPQGEHINEYLRVIFEELCDKFEKEHKKKVTVIHLKKHVSLILRCKLDKPAFDSQIKKKLVKPKPKVQLPKKLQKDVLKWELDEELRKMFNMKTKAQDRKS